MPLARNAHGVVVADEEGSRCRGERHGAVVGGISAGLVME
jgi:hypothetical protein